MEGNLVAKRRVNYARKLLAESGLEMERLRMVNVSAANARLLVDHLQKMSETIQKLGPSAINKAKRQKQQEIRS
jgi:coenzyme F420-reducing hydrogenase delta subunit